MPSVQAIEDAVLLKPIRRAFSATGGINGSPRIKQTLDAMGYPCGRHRVARLMREDELVARQAKRYRPRPGRAAQYQVPNRLLEPGPAGRRGEVWVGDYTYIQTQRGWLFLVSGDWPHERGQFSRARSLALRSRRVKLGLDAAHRHGRRSDRWRPKSNLLSFALA